MTRKPGPQMAQMPICLNMTTMTRALLALAALLGAIGREVAAHRGLPLQFGAGLQLVRADGTWNLDPLDFDEFMEICRAAGAKPIGSDRGRS